MTLKKSLLVILVLVVGVAGCRSSRPRGGRTASEDRRVGSAQLAGSTWTFAAFGQAAREADEPGTDAAAPAITATFGEGGRLTGTAGCNRYFGNYETKEGHLAISQVGTTRKACAPRSVMARERAFLSALQSVEQWRRTAGRLLLLNEAGGRLLGFAERAGEASSEKASASRAGAFVFTCSVEQGADFRFRMKPAPGKLALWLPERFGGRFLILKQVRSADGARYESDDVTVWNKGREALLRIGDQTYHGCRQAS